MKLDRAKDGPRRWRAIVLVPVVVDLDGPKSVNDAVNSTRAWMGDKQVRVGDEIYHGKILSLTGAEDDINKWRDEETVFLVTQGAGKSLEEEMDAADRNEEDPDPPPDGHSAA